MPEIYQKIPFPIFFSKYVTDNLSEDALVPLPHVPFSLLSLLNVRSGGKMYSIFLSPMKNLQKS